MAHLIPNNNTAFATSGERRFYAFLRDAVKPDAQCLAWYSPSVDGLEPDFVLYTPETGLVVFEVKDWPLTMIQAADTRSFTLDMGEGRQEARANPMQQAREYVFAILDRIKSSCKRLLSSEPRYQGKPRLPVQGGVVFSNITRADFAATDLPRVLPADKAIFADDLAAACLEPPEAESWRGILAKMFHPPFAFKLGAADLDALREALWPQAKIVLPERAGAGRKSDEDDAARVRLFDAQQESLARRLDAPRAVIEGPAGSGKSLVLIHKAIQEHSRLRSSGCKLPVLIICYNLTLVHYLKRLLAGHNARLGRNEIQVTHFYAFCRSLLAEQLPFENEDSAYYETVTQLALEAASTASGYGAVFVDEGQDFSDDMLSVLQAVLDGKGMFWLALDSGQNLYGPRQTWFDDASFRHFHLRRSYRATQRLADFCSALLRRNEPYGETEPDHPAFTVQTAEGEKPVLRRVESAGDAAAYLVERIQSLHGAGLPYSEIMVLYASRRYAGLEEDLPVFLRDALEEHGILAAWPARDAQSKAAWDITTDSVAISTIHSMKGMDAAAVFVLGLDTLRAEVSPQALAYVACTRARQHLEILYREETELIGAMRRELA